MLAARELALTASSGGLKKAIEAAASHGHVEVVASLLESSNWLAVAHGPLNAPQFAIEAAAATAPFAVLDFLLGEASLPVRERLRIGARWAVVAAVESCQPAVVQRLLHHFRPGDAADALAKL